MIRLDNVTKTYQRRGSTVTAFACQSLTIETGEYIAVVGPSGSGKSTLLSILGGMLSPTTGQVWIDDLSLYDQSATGRATIRRNEMGFVFQTFNLVPYLTSLENVQVPLCLAAKKGAEQRERATAILERLGLKDRLGHKPAELSIGQQQRVALARTLVSDPKIILADEPTGNLDPDSREVVLKAMHELHQLGKTVVTVTHDPQVARRAQKVLSLKHGHLVDTPTWIDERAA